MRVEELQFTDLIPVRKLRGVYLLWKDGEVVYVGQSESIQQRVSTHLADPKKYFNAVSYAVVETGDLNQLEADLIVKYDPYLDHGLPRNTKYVTKNHIKKHLGIGGWDLRKILRNIKPIWRDYYLVSDVLGVK